MTENVPDLAACARYLRTRLAGCGGGRPLNLVVRLPMTRLLFALGAAVAFQAAAAAEPPPAVPFDSITWQPSMKREPTKGISLGKVRVAFERTTLADVARAASSGVISQQGDAAAHVLWLCYSVRGPTGLIGIWFVSDGEMGGAKHAITGIAVSPLERRASPDCPMLPAAMQPARFDIPIWPGSSEAHIDESLGSPSHVEGNWRAYDFQTRIREDGHCDGSYSMSNWLFTKSESGIITAIFAGEATSC